MKETAIMTQTSPKKINLNGKFYKAEEDNRLNVYQKAHLAGEFNVNAPIYQEGGGEPLPPLSQQWKEEKQRRINVKKRSRNR